MVHTIGDINLDGSDGSVKEIINCNFINLKFDGKETMFVNKKYAWDLMVEFVRLQVANGNLIPKEGFDVDGLNEKQVKEAVEFVKNIFGE